MCSIHFFPIVLHMKKVSLEILSTLKHIHYEVEILSTSKHIHYEVEILSTLKHIHYEVWQVEL